MTQFVTGKSPEKKYVFVPSSQFSTPGNFLEKCLQFSWQGV